MYPTIMMLILLSVQTGLPVRQRSPVEQAVYSILMREEGYPGPLAEALRNAGPEAEVRAVLLKWLRIREPDLRTIKGHQLDAAIGAVGALKASWAIEPVTQALLDPAVHETTRSWAAQVLGEIDPMAAQDVLMAALDPGFADYPFIRVNAAKSLAKTEDPQVLKLLEQRVASEKDEFTRKLLEEVVEAMRREIEGKPQ